MAELCRIVIAAFTSDDQSEKTITLTGTHATTLKEVSFIASVEVTYSLPWWITCKLTSGWQYFEDQDQLARRRFIPAEFTFDPQLTHICLSDTKVAFFSKAESLQEYPLEGVSLQSLSRSLGLNNIDLKGRKVIGRAVKAILSSGTTFDFHRDKSHILVLSATENLIPFNLSHESRS